MLGRVIFAVALAVGVLVTALELSAAVHRHHRPAPRAPSVTDTVTGRSESSPLPAAPEHDDPPLPPSPTLTY